MAGHARTSSRSNPSVRHAPRPCTLSSRATTPRDRPLWRPYVMTSPASRPSDGHGPVPTSLPPQPPSHVPECPLDAHPDAAAAVSHRLPHPWCAWQNRDSPQTNPRSAPTLALRWRRLTLRPSHTHCASLNCAASPATGAAYRGLSWSVCRAQPASCLMTSLSCSRSRLQAAQRRHTTRLPCSLTFVCMILAARPSCTSHNDERCSTARARCFQRTSHG